MLPEGWRRCTIDDIAKVSSGGTPDRSRAEYWGGDIPWVTTGEIGNGPIDHTAEKITEIGLRNSAAKIFPAGTLLMAMYGQGKTRGRIAALSIKASTNQACAAIIAAEDSSADFLFHNLRSRYEEIRNLSNDGSQKNLSAGLIKALPILLPPLPEQRKIAEILSTWDAAICAQERLIANARAQKKALMQTLFPTGAHPPKKRLPGFSGEWREIKLRDLGRCYNGVTYAPADVVDGTGLLILRSSNVQNGRLDFADTVFVKPGVKTSCLTREGDILICVRNGSRNLIGKTARISSDATGHAHGAFMSLFRSTEPDFAYHLFQSHAYEQQVKRNLGATINSINTSDLHDFRFMVPPKPERARIAEILSANDREIEQHERLLLGTCAQKSALMQQLLTGKRRVKVDLEIKSC